MGALHYPIQFGPDMAGYTLEFYEPGGTTTPKKAYVDAAATDATSFLTLTLGSNGLGTAFLKGKYYIRVLDTASAEVKAWDNVTGSPDLSLDGWVDYEETLEYLTFTGGLYTFKVKGANVESRYPVGRWLKLSGTAFSEVITAVESVAYSAPDTTITCYITSGDTPDGTLNEVLAGPTKETAVNYKHIGYPILAAEVVSGAVVVTNVEYPYNNVLRFGADPTGVAGSSTAINNCCLAVNNAVQTVSGPSAGTTVDVFFPSGTYKINASINSPSYMRYIGEHSILQIDAGITAFTNVDYLTIFDKLDFIDGAKAIEIKTANVDKTVIIMENCIFQGQTVNSISADSVSASSIYVVNNCRFVNTNTGANILDMAAGFWYVNDCWVTSDCTDSFVVGYSGATTTPSNVSFTNVTLVPSTAAGTSWFKVWAGSLKTKNVRAGGESGGVTFVEWRWNSDRDPTNPIIDCLVIEDSDIYVSADYSIKFYELPHVIKLNGVYGLTGGDGIWFDPSMNATNLKEIDKFGWLDFTIDGVVQETLSQTFGNAEAEVKTLTSKSHKVSTYYLDDADYILRIPVTSGVFGRAISTNASATLDVSTYTTMFGLPAYELTGSSASDDGEHSLDFTTALNGLSAGLKTFAVEVYNKSDTMFTAQLIASEKAKRFIIPPGRHILSMPFYFKATYDESLRFELNKIKNGKAIQYGEFRLFNGQVDIDTPNTITYSSAAPAPPAGGGIGDICIKVDPAETGAKQTIRGWHRQTSGTGNVLDTDWFQDITLTKQLATSTANVSNPPTDAELDSAFGTPATVGAGFTVLLDDAGGNANVYLVQSNGTSWWYSTLTKAV